MVVSRSVKASQTTLGFTVMLTLAAAGTAHAKGDEPLRFLVCQPGGPTLEDQEQTVIRDFYRFISTKRIPFIENCP